MQAEPNFVYREHTATVRGVAWSPQGQWIASSGDVITGGQPAQLCVWDPVSGQTALRCVIPYSVTAIAWSPDGSRLATAGSGKVMSIWEPPSDRPVATYDTPLWLTYDIAWSPDGTRLALAGEADMAQVEGTEVPVLAAETGQILVQYRHHTGLGTRGVAWSPDSTQIASAGMTDYTLQVWSSETGKPVSRHEIAGQRDVVSVAWSPQGALVASGTEWGPIRLHDPETGSELQVMENGLGEWVCALALAWSVDGRFLACANFFGDARVWDAKSGELVAIYPGVSMPSASTGRSPVWDLTWSPDGKHVATVTDGSVEIWTFAPQ